MMYIVPSVAVDAPAQGPRARQIATMSTAPTVMHMVGGEVRPRLRGGRSRPAAGSPKECSQQCRPVVGRKLFARAPTSDARPHQPRCGVASNMSLRGSGRHDAVEPATRPMLAIGMIDRRRTRIKTCCTGDPRYGIGRVPSGAGDLLGTDRSTSVLVERPVAALRRAQGPWPVLVLRSGKRGAE